MSGPLSRENRSFADLALTLSGTTCGILGWTVDQFWSATPAELAAIFAVLSENESGHYAAVPLDSAQLAILKENNPDG